MGSSPIIRSIQGVAQLVAHYVWGVGVESSSLSILTNFFFGVYMKYCTKCSINKDESCFAQRKLKTKTILQSWCKDCMNKNRMNRYHINKKKEIEVKIRYKQGLKDFIDSIKSTLKCELCGEDNPIVLDFHHLDPSEKDFTLSDAVRLSKSKKKILNEISKCMVLCANCHRIIHYKEGE